MILLDIYRNDKYGYIVKTLLHIVITLFLNEFHDSLFVKKFFDNLKLNEPPKFKLKVIFSKIHFLQIFFMLSTLEENESIIPFNFIQFCP